MPVPSRSQFRAETRRCWTRSGHEKTGLNRLRSHLNCWDPSRCRCWVSPRWMDCPAYLPFQQARRAGLQNGQSRLSGGIVCFLRSDRESSEVTSNPDPTRGLGALRPRSDAAPVPGPSPSRVPRSPAPTEAQPCHTRCAEGRGRIHASSHPRSLIECNYGPLRGC